MQGLRWLRRQRSGLRCTGPVWRCTNMLGRTCASIELNPTKALVPGICTRSPHQWQAGSRRLSAIPCTPLYPHSKTSCMPQLLVARPRRRTHATYRTSWLVSKARAFPVAHWYMSAAQCCAVRHTPISAGSFARRPCTYPPFPVRHGPGRGHASAEPE